MRAARCACGGVADRPGGECARCKAARARRAQRNRGALAPARVTDVLSSPGRALDDSARRTMEAGFGRDLSRIRVHTDDHAAESSRAVNAKAYTVGDHVVFGRGEYRPGTAAGRELIAHEVAHARQQDGASASGDLRFADDARAERQAQAAGAAISARRPVPALNRVSSMAVARQPVADELPPVVQRDYTPDWSLFLRPMSAPAVQERCKEFPGGSTDCDVDASGTPTGRVTTQIDETNPCTRPCVEKHEAVHVNQLKRLCAAVRDCYVQADKGRRPVTDCFKMAVASGAKNECEAYTVSVPCVEQRLKSAPACKSPENQRYGAEKLKSENCFRDHACSPAKKP